MRIGSVVGGPSVRQEKQMKQYAWKGAKGYYWITFDDHPNRNPPPVVR
jgi:hypothetical protein